MSKKDKEQLFGTLVVVLLFLLILLFTKGTKNLPIFKSVYFLVVLKIGAMFLQPKIVELFYKVHKMQAPMLRYVPFFNETLIMEGKYAILVLTSYVMLAVTLGAFFIPLNTVLAIFGEAVALNYSLFLVRGIAVVIILHCILYGIALNSVITKVNKLYMKGMQVSKPQIGVLFKAFSFLPWARLVCLVLVYNTLTVLIKFGCVRGEE